MIQIDFSRADGHATFMSYRTHGTDPYFDMCRVLRDRNWLDIDAVFVDERGVRCVTVRSIHSCARRYRPTQDDKDLLELLRQAEASR